MTIARLKSQTLRKWKEARRNNKVVFSAPVANNETDQSMTNGRIYIPVYEKAAKDCCKKEHMKAVRRSVFVAFLVTADIRRS